VKTTRRSFEARQNKVDGRTEAIPFRSPLAEYRWAPRECRIGEVLDRAMRLFWERGFEATSISELTEAMGITPPTLYSFFGDKKQLFLEAVHRYQSGPGCFAIKALTEEPTAERSMRISDLAG
jgi:hypothetical protein